MPVSVIVDDCNEREQVYILDPGNSRIKCLTMDGKFIENLGKKRTMELSFEAHLRFSKHVLRIYMWYRLMNRVYALFAGSFVHNSYIVTFNFLAYDIIYLIVMRLRLWSELSFRIIGFSQRQEKVQFVD